MLENNTIRYTKILKRYDKEINYFSTKKGLMQNKEFQTLLGQKTVSITFPVLINWTIWVLKEAEKRKINKLYFLARDGKIVYQIAQTIAQKYNPNITCHYLYCSRKSLRAGLYCIDQELALEKICLNSYEVTPDIVLERAGIMPELRDNVLNELGIKHNHRMKQLNRHELLILKEKLRTNHFFQSIAFEESKKAYSLILEYLDQEGLLDDTVPYGIVDSGWVGSMQQILSRYVVGKNPNLSCIHGFYFGLFGNKNDIHNQYHSFYFSKKRGIRHFTFFNNNLFECLCAADHGMTIRYEKENGIIIPILNEYKETSPYIKFHFDCIGEYISTLSVNWNTVSNKTLIQMTFRLLKILMATPDRDEIKLYGSIPFCDDPTERYFYPLAPKYTMMQMRDYSIFMKLWNNIVRKNSSTENAKSFWPWATISQLEQGRLYYRINYYLWMFLLWYKNTKN